MSPGTNRTIEELIQQLSDGDVDSTQKEELRILSSAIPKSYKDSYDHLQEKTRKRFGVMLKAVIMLTIDKALESQAK